MGQQKLLFFIINRSSFSRFKFQNEHVPGRYLSSKLIFGHYSSFGAVNPIS
jgi:hypothetical protein